MACKRRRPGAFFRAMKSAPFLALLFLPLAAFGRDTAYQALRTMGAARDQSLLNRVIEVKGRSGIPQPSTWIIILDDPLARGGVREIEVSNSHIVSERTPVKAYSGTSDDLVMNFRKLNLDSEGAFAVAENVARNAHVGFDTVDYVLRCDSANVAPTWSLQLLDDKQHSVGSVVVSADTGAVVKSSFGASGPRFGAKSDQSYSRPQKAEATQDDDEYARTHNLGHRIDRSLRRAGATMEEFFTGRRTLDRAFEGE